ncbi:MAG: leucine-rich repeat domain-containing protein, partial [Kiritimatiellaeota bacterium]|nr:leucine-rich repeat domain-containing protein [Kiritimatiellota bacterium]
MMRRCGGLCKSSLQGWGAACGVAFAVAGASGLRADVDWYWDEADGGMITNAVGWMFLVERDGNALTVTNCVGVPEVGSMLDFSGAIENGYAIVSLGVATAQGEALLYPTYNDKMTSLILPETLVTIGNDAFVLSTSLQQETLVIPDSVKTIYNGAFASSGFAGGTGTTLTLGSSVEYIGNSAFWYSPGLVGDLVIPDSVTTFGNHVFRDTRFASITVGANVTHFGDSVFSINPALETVFYKGVFPDIASVDSFYKDSPNVTSVIFRANCGSWEASGEVSGGDIADEVSAATWYGQPIVCVDWIYTPGNGGMLMDAVGWTFEAALDGNEMTVVSCVAAPSEGSMLDFSGTVAGGYAIVTIGPKTEEGGPVLNIYSGMMT